MKKLFKYISLIILCANAYGASVQEIQSIDGAQRNRLEEIIKANAGGGGGGSGDGTVTNVVSTFDIITTSGAGGAVITLSKTASLVWTNTAGFVDVGSFDSVNSVLLGSGGVSNNWFSGLLTSSDGSLSVNYNGRTLNREGGNTILDFQNAQGNDVSGVTSILWSGRTLRNSGGSVNVLDWQASLLRSDSGADALDWENRTLNNASSVAKLNWAAQRIENTWTNRGDFVILTNLTVGATANVSSNLTVDTTTLFADALNNRVGVGTITPGFTFDVSGNANVFGLLSVTGAVAKIDAPLGSLTLSASNALHFVSIAGGQKITRTIVSVNYTNKLGDFYIAMRPTVAAVTNFLPSATSVGAGVSYVIKDEGLKASVTNIFVFPLSGDLIDGATSRTLNTDATSINVTSDGVNGWFVY